MTPDELVALVRSGRSFESAAIGAFNLRGRDLSGLRAPRSKLAELSLEGANLTGAICAAPR